MEELKPRFSWWWRGWFLRLMFLSLFGVDESFWNQCCRDVNNINNNNNNNNNNIPIPSMYGILTYICMIFSRYINVEKYTIVPWMSHGINNHQPRLASKVTLKIDEVPDVVAPERRRFRWRMDLWNPQKMMDPVEDVQMFGVHVGFSGVYLYA